MRDTTRDDFLPLGTAGEGQGKGNCTVQTKAALLREGSTFIFGVDTQLSN